MTFHVGALACKTFRQGNIVRIHAGDKGGPRQGEALVQGGYQAPVFPLHQPDAAIFRRQCPQDAAGSIGGAVIHEDQLEIPQRLRQNGGDSLSHIGGRIVHGQEHGNGGH